MTEFKYKSKPAVPDYNAYQPEQYMLALKTTDKRIITELLYELKKLLEAYEYEPERKE